MSTYNIVCLIILYLLLFIYNYSLTVAYFTGRFNWSNINDERKFAFKMSLLQPVFFISCLWFLFEANGIKNFNKYGIKF